MKVLTKKIWIYVIGLAGLDGYSKIGVSHNIANRVKAISTNCPFKPYVAHSHKVGDSYFARIAESESHKALKQYRVNGEWFKLPPLVAWQVVKPIAIRNSGGFASC